MAFWLGLIIFAIVIVVLILVLPASILHALGNIIGKAISAISNAVGSKLQAASTYNSPK